MIHIGSEVVALSASVYYLNSQLSNTTVQFEQKIDDLKKHCDKINQSMALYFNTLITELANEVGTPTSSIDVDEELIARLERKLENMKKML